MNERLVLPPEAGASLAKILDRTWADRICAEVRGDALPPLELRLRPGVSSSASVERLGFGAWHEWREAWRAAEVTHLDGVVVEETPIRVVGHPVLAPVRVCVETTSNCLEAISALCGVSDRIRIERARTVAHRLDAAGAVLTPATLRAATRLPDPDLDIALDAVAWLSNHADTSAWTPRQLPVPGMHTKWLQAHRAVLAALAGRDVTVETRPRLAVIHLTYVDPTYLASGGRRHDSWTSGDRHELAYAPRNVLIVENRDCRLWFPDLANTVVVEGGGKAAAAHLRDVDWLANAQRVFYWGDIDSDGFAILDRLRSELSPAVAVESILMDGAAFERYAHLGVTRDAKGITLRPSSTRLDHLTPAEAECHATIATAGPAVVRRIEQERIDLADAQRVLKESVSS